MNVTSLSLQDFRNLSQVKLKPCPGVNIIYGDNAQGKTNLLESLWLFTGSRSFRGAKDGDYLPFGGEQAVLELSFYGMEREQTARLAYSSVGKGSRKKVWLNEILLPGTSGLAGKFTGVVFSPDHLSLVKEGPEERRRFLDMAIGQLMPRYLTYLHSYNRIIAQRNSLLKDALRHSALLDTLDVWDDHLIRVGTAVAAARLRYIALLTPMAGEIYHGISQGKEQLELACLPSWQDSPLREEIPRDEISRRMAEALREARKNDLYQGNTSVGPHRDDLVMLVDGTSLRTYGSQGQQRSSVLALKLAECGILYESTKEHPIILLDDVMSELDSQRRDYLLNHLEGRQVFITCCDKGYFQSLREGKTFHMEAGCLKEG